MSSIYPAVVRNAIGRVRDAHQGLTHDQTGREGDQLMLAERDAFASLNRHLHQASHAVAQGNIKRQVHRQTDQHAQSGHGSGAQQAHRSQAPREYLSIGTLLSRTASMIPINAPP